MKDLLLVFGPQLGWFGSDVSSRSDAMGLEEFGWFGGIRGGFMGEKYCFG